jgi:hypothetical protein
VSARKKCRLCKIRTIGQVGEKIRGTCNYCHMLFCKVPPGGDRPAGWPRKSLALAVHPSQIAEAYQDARDRGVPTEFAKDGQPIMQNAAHQKAYSKAYGFINRDAFY